MNALIDAFHAGGYTMFLIVVLGIVMLVAAGRFARSANPQGLALVRALTLAMSFSVVAGVFANLIAVCNAIGNNPEWAKEPLPILIEGFGESVNPIVFGGSLCAIAWILVAFGVRRMPRDGQ